MKYIILIICLLVTVSCGVDKEVIVKSTIKLEGKNTNIRDLLDIDGYYPVPIDSDDVHAPHDPIFGKDPIIGNIMFFEDGTSVCFFFKRGVPYDIRGVPYEKVKKNMSKYIEGKMKGKQFHWWGADWGVYSIHNDTIVEHSYMKLPLYLYLNEYRYKIIDRKTIQQIYGRSLLKSDDVYYIDKSPWIIGDPMHFMPADSLPSSDSYSWLKKQKWIWHNESDWKDYMDRIKQEANKKKTKDKETKEARQ